VRTTPLDRLRLYCIRDLVKHSTESTRLLERIFGFTSKKERKIMGQVYALCIYGLILE
jgi:hypothetical protein